MNVIISRAILLLFILGLSSQAATRQWTGMSTNLPPQWSDPDNWKDGVPGELDDVIIGEPPYSSTAHISVQGPIKLKSLFMTRATLIGSAQFEVSTLTSKGSVVSGGGSMKITSGGSVLPGPTGEYGLVIDGWTINNEGNLSIAVNASVVFFASAGRLNNSGVIDFNDVTTIDGLSGAGSVLVNSGTIRKLAGAGKATINALQFVNTGQVISASGRISFPVGSVDNSGNMIIQGSENTIIFEGASVALNGGALTGDGEFIVRGNTVLSVNVDTPIDILNLSANITGPAKLTVQKNFTWSAGVLSGQGQIISVTQMRIEDPSGGAIRRISGRIIRNQGKAIWASGDIGIQDGGQIINELPGEFTIGDLADKQLAGSYLDPAGFLNYGLLKLIKENGRKTSFYCVFSSTNRFEYSSSVALYGGGTQSGAWVQVDPSAGRLEIISATNYWDTGFTSKTTIPVVIRGGVVDVRGAALADAVELNGGNIDGVGALTVSKSFLWTSGNIRGSGLLRIPELATLDWGSVAGPRELIQRTIELAGRGFWYSINFTASEGAVLRITETGTLMAGAAETMQWGTGAIPLVDNRGRFEKTTGTGTAYFGTAFANSGIVIVRQGKIQFATGYIQDAGYTQIDANAEVQVRNMTNNFAGDIFGFGRLSGGTTNFGTLRPGHSPGALTLGGDLRQMSDGRVEIELGGYQAGTEYDQVNIEGAAMLDGTLDIKLLNGFVPAVGDRFDVMTFQSRVGTFKVKTGDYFAPGVALVPEYSSTKLTLVATAIASESPTIEIVGDGSTPRSKIWRWPSTPGKTYQVESSNDLLRWIFFNSITASDSTTQLELPAPDLGEMARFYRVH